MFRPEKTSCRLPLAGAAGHWLRLLLLLAALCPPAIFGADASPAGTNWIFDATNHLGQWIWETNTADKQTCRFWKAFEIPGGAKVANATLRITVDNGYLLFLDGREIGRGSDWKTVTIYDVSRLLNPGWHILGVEGFNDRLQAGLVLGLHIQLVDEEQSTLDVVSDNTWRVVPNAQRSWAGKKTAPSDWHFAIVVGTVGKPPWQPWPFGLTAEPALMPIVVHFWETVWFQLSVLTLLLLAIGVCLWLSAQLSLQARSQKLLQAERVRIARDIHDDLGAQLTQLVLLGEVAQREQPEDSPARTQFKQICRLARELSHGMDEVVWAVNARRDTLRDFANYVCKYAQVFLNPTTIRCRLDVEPELPATMFDLPVRRNLFLAVKEALNNAAKYSGAAELFLRIYRADDKLVVTVEDDGRGFDPEQLGDERNGLTNMTQRMHEINGVCELFSLPGGGCRVVFTVPLENQPQRGWLNWLKRRPAPDEATTEIE